VDIAVNGDVIEGYSIKNGVKQGDSLSCILFILCIDPLIRNIEMNNKINRVEIEDIALPKIVAYADDITCMTDSARSIKHIFKEYEKLSKAANLILNADKTEILDVRENVHNIQYMGESFSVRGSKVVKINGIILTTDLDDMKERNYRLLTEKIINSLASWKTRQLSLLGRILIYKTFGLSQVTYPLSIIKLDTQQCNKIERLFDNFICGRDLQSNTSQFRIAKDRLCASMANGGFGMISFQNVIKGIRCRQLCKLFDPQYCHPLKYLTIKDGVSLISGHSLTPLADEVAIEAHRHLINYNINCIKNSLDDQIITDLVMLEQIGEIDVSQIIKQGWIYRPETTNLIHINMCRNIKDIIDRGRRIMPITNKVVKGPYLRIIRLLINNNIQCPLQSIDRLKNKNGRYKNIFLIASKEFREMLNGEQKVLKSKYIGDIDNYVVKEYLTQIKRLTNTKHKNTLLRVWNGDCLSYTRLRHMGITDVNTCPNCNELDTPEHMLLECEVAQNVWNKILRKFPRNQNITKWMYVMGINDSKNMLAIKAEIIKYLMHFRELNSEQILQRTLLYLKCVNSRNVELLEVIEALELT
jgi:hypothetical protein